MTTITLKPNTAIVSVLEPVNLYDLLFDTKDEKRIMGIQTAAQYNKIKILKVTEQEMTTKTGKQLEIHEGDICIIAKSAISIVSEESNMTLGFVYTDNVVAKIEEN